MNSLVLKPMRFGSDDGSYNAYLVFRGNQLIAILVHSVTEIDGITKSWRLDTGVDSCEAERLSFGTLEDAQVWIRDHMCGMASAFLDS